MSTVLTVPEIALRVEKYTPRAEHVRIKVLTDRREGAIAPELGNTECRHAHFGVRELKMIMVVDVNSFHRYLILPCENLLVS